jgi:hypothetical protein
MVSLLFLREYVSYGLPRGGHQTPRSVRPGDVLTDVAGPPMHSSLLHESGPYVKLAQMSRRTTVPEAI